MFLASNDLRNEWPPNDFRPNPIFLTVLICSVAFKNLHKKEPNHWVLSFAWQRPILAGGDPPTTIGVLKLNFRVRHGNGCIL